MSSLLYSNRVIGVPQKIVFGVLIKKIRQELEYSSAFCGLIIPSAHLGLT
jgi:hypothetical protein